MDCVTENLLYLLRYGFQKTGTDAVQKVATDLLICIQAIGEIAGRIPQTPMAAHNRRKFPKSFAAAGESLRLSILAQTAHIFGQTTHRITLADPDENVPVHAPVQRLIQIPDLAKNLSPEINRLLKNVVGEINQFPKIERL